MGVDRPPMSSTRILLGLGVGGLIPAADFLASWPPGLNPKWTPVVLHGAVALA